VLKNILKFSIRSGVEHIKIEQQTPIKTKK